jgi:hypothetical protein
MTRDSPFPVSTLVPSPTSGRIEMDNLIRRELRVGDPNDARQVASALMQRYADTPTVRSLINEPKGLPSPQAVMATAPVLIAQTATSLDLQQAKDDIELDLREVLTSNLLKDFVPELGGWADAIRAAVREGERSAPLALDTQQRDKTFAMRRQLGDYALAARLVGSFSAGTRDDFRNLAQSLDEASAVLLVMMGEAIADTGIAGGRYLMQVPFSELQSRREAVLYALRNLMGSTQLAYGPNDLPRGLDAYRKLLAVLEQQGQGELRSLLTESEMSRVMDQLIDRAGHGVNGLRALASTAQIDVQRFERLLATIQWNVDAAGGSPPLLALQEALRLFIDGFENCGGIRLVNMARPAILRYGLYRNRPPGPAERRFNRLMEARGTLAALVDAMAETGFDEATTRCIVLLDEAQYCLDRALDFHCVGIADEGGKPEIRAAAHGQVIAAIMERLEAEPPLAAVAKGSEVVELFEQQARDLLRAINVDTATRDQHGWMVQELVNLWQHEADARQTVAQLVGEAPALDKSFRGSDGQLGRGQPTGDIPFVLWQAFATHKLHLPAFELNLPATLEASLATISAAQVEDVRISSHVQLDASERMVRQLAALEEDSEEALEAAAKKKGNAVRIPLRINEEGEEVADPILYQDLVAAQQALAALHRRLAAAKTAHRHLLGRRTAADNTIGPIPFRTV